jgi:hypothetical protein
MKLRNPTNNRPVMEAKMKDRRVGRIVLRTLTTTMMVILARKNLRTASLICRGIKELNDPSDC